MDWVIKNAFVVIQPSRLPNPIKVIIIFFNVLHSHLGLYSSNSSNNNKQPFFYDLLIPDNPNEPVLSQRRTTTGFLWAECPFCHYRKTQWFGRLLFHRHGISTPCLTNIVKALKEATWDYAWNIKSILSRWHSKYHQRFTEISEGFISFALVWVHSIALPLSFDRVGLID